MSTQKRPVPSKISALQLRARKSVRGPDPHAVEQTSAPADKTDKIVAVTAYDVTFARLADSAGVDVVLVGDSLGMVMQGHEDTLPVTLDDVVYHCRSVRRGLRRAHLVADMPFMSYQASADEAVANAGRLVKEGGAESVKLEGGAGLAALVARLVAAGIPVMGHVGLTPQSVHALGGFKVQGRDAPAADRIVEDAQALAQAGAFAIVAEGVPAGVGERLSESVPVPIIGIGAGPDCDGQILVMHDLLGLDPAWSPRFARRYAELGAVAQEAFERFRDEVRSGAFPGEEESFR